ncbi:hypothetical protein Q5H93_02705 [Hymenobacter sp. ASUV-10]|uniref:DUF3298 domain-containing protein n=1 Tax=Hymenobacter aranciens TaxID=3063996 RepID=A0ABT9BAQ5_9BACT|nr:hypothetical protein [Hymenobacter sp. ASUV-10]MDO7873628.1 hypothetical protein [Hymenobacter sp. ASUV-10]
MTGFHWLLAALLLNTLNVCGQAKRLPVNRLEHYTDHGPRRWRGTIGGQAVTLQLDSNRWGYSGSYYYDRRGRELHLYSEKGPTKRNQLTLRETVESATTGYFELNKPIGVQLSGTWRSPDGKRRLPLALHETYADALAYDEETWELNRFVVSPYHPNTNIDSATFHQSYLRLRQPLTAATRQIQQALRRPAPVRRMGHYLDSLLRVKQEVRSDYSFTGYQYVLYNSNYLFSVVQFEHFNTLHYDDDAYSHQRSRRSTYDLRTGRRLALPDLLRSNYGPQLRRLLLQQLKPVWENPHYDQVGANGKLPASGFLVTATGLSFTYDERDDESLSFPGPYHADQTIEVEIPYETLLPILRPDSPLTTLLLERKLLTRK